VTEERPTVFICGGAVVGQQDQSFESRIQRARLSLEGLSLGDAFGQRSGPVVSKVLPSGPWTVSDDTMMAWSMLQVFETKESLDQNLLAAILAERYEDDSSRGYDKEMHRVLSEISGGRNWEHVASESFHGRGSRGNGAAIRVAPLGAFYADDLDQLILQAARSAVVTHTHPEAAHGAMVVALAAAAAWKSRRINKTVKGRSFLETVRRKTPIGPMRQAVTLARDLPPGTSSKRAAELLGSGAKCLAIDTVPLALWISAHNLSNFEKALWTVLKVAVDRDTVGAMVGGIIAQAVGYQGLPMEWRKRRESYQDYEPDPIFGDQKESGEELIHASAED
jgi:ADP-ribosylglycohydrolase